MTDQPTDHRTEADRYLAGAEDPDTNPDADDIADFTGLGILHILLAIHDALLAQDHNRCTATRGHANGHAFPAEQPAATSTVDPHARPDLIGGPER